MTDFLKILFSLSFSGTLLILVFFLLKPLWKEKLSKQWQYYIWLIVIARLFLPFAPEINLVGTIFQQLETNVMQAEQAIQEAAEVLSETEQIPMNENNDHSTNGGKTLVTSNLPLLQNTLPLSMCIFLVWLTTALILCVRKITIYQGFARYIKSGQKLVYDIDILNCFSLLLSEAGIKKNIELAANPLISSPLFMGFLKPCIVLQDVSLADAGFCYTIRHELMHYKRRDMYYKWLVQLAVCIHWFNPFVYLMGREINQACELSCDEALICHMDAEEKAAYGDTLLNAMEAGGRYTESLASVTLGESKLLLKERLGAIMSYKKKSKLVVFGTIVFTLFLASGAAAAGVYAAPYQKNASRAALPALPMNSNILYEDGIYYILCDGATADDRPISGITEGYIGLRLVWKDHYSSYGPYDDPQHLAEDVKKQCDYLLGKKAITSEEAKLLIDAAADIQLFYKQNSGKAAYDVPTNSRSKEYAKWGIRYENAEDAYYYNNVRIRLFADFRQDHSLTAFHYDKTYGTVDLQVVRDQNDAIQKVEFLTDAETDEVLRLFTKETLPSGGSGNAANNTDAKALELMQKTGNWGYIEPFLPQMTNAGIDAVVSCYNSKHFNPNEYKKASDYYNAIPKTSETGRPNGSSGFDYSVFSSLDTLTSAEADALALSYIAETGQFGHVYNLRPYMTTAGIDAAVKAYLNADGDVGVVLAMLPDMSEAMAKKVKEIALQAW